MTSFDHLEISLNEAPIFPVEKPDGRKGLAEISRAVDFQRIIRMTGPSVSMFANANAGKRNPRLAQREGIKAGVFDYTLAWGCGGICFVELKGYDKSGRPGKLSQSQIDWGNRMHRLGHKVAAFFDPIEAARFVASCGAPMREITREA